VRLVHYVIDYNHNVRMTISNILRACSQSGPNTSRFSTFHPQIKRPCLSDCESRTPRNAGMTLSVPSNYQFKLTYTVEVRNNQSEVTSYWRGEMDGTPVDLWR
jgi:hypothetical protein